MSINSGNNVEAALDVEFSDSKIDAIIPINVEEHAEATLIATNVRLPETLEKLERKITQKEIRQAKKALEIGRKNIAKSKYEDALPHLMSAWDIVPEDLDLLTLISFCLMTLGVRDKAILVIERALKFHAPTTDLVSMMLTLSLSMRIHDVAVKLGNLLIAMEPNQPKHYVNLATAYSAQDKYDEGIEMLQSVIPMFPDESDLWNVLATQVRARDGAEKSLIFFEEAIRLNPSDYKIYSNLSMSYSQLMDWDKAIEADRKSIELNPESPEPHLGLSTLLFLTGEIEEAWEHYDYRLSATRDNNQTQIYTHAIPEWQGEDLIGKKLFLAAEQGIGDEIMWGNFFRFLEEKADQLIIGCEPRLVSIYERSYPDAIITPFIDVIRQGYRYRSFPKIQGMINNGDITVDYAIPLASAAKFSWFGASDVQYFGKPHLTADPSLKEEFSERITAISSKPKIGLAWRSGIKSKKRSHLYGSVEHFSTFKDLAEKVDFINLQYDDCSEELGQFEELYGIKVHDFKDVNLKQDIEANLAIMENCDLVVAGMSAPAMFSMSLGQKTIVMGQADPWWLFGAADRIVSFVKSARVVTDNGKGWPDTVGRTYRAIKEELGIS